jgi:hypothetical protein
VATSRHVAVGSDSQLFELCLVGVGFEQKIACYFSLTSLKDFEIKMLVIPLIGYRVLKFFH